ncbi:hypothetical protein SAY87_030426 [Trapa incisa]|uniref:E3 ubiquitin-protein ligase RMA n=1 Tax=Trapa incisa TaxID=236973 RepID=A0AAN7QJV8_9MYRT|nr:hypothetical protein SAY87_030426 [Trapa incisa]
MEQHAQVLPNNPICCETGDLKSFPAAAAAAKLEEPHQPTDFECNICLDTVKDPVVTFCGHLYCWPCIYRWLEVQRAASSETPEEALPQSQQCPVCKANVSTSTLVPLYGRGRAASAHSGSKPSKSKEHAKHLGGIVIPRRPPACSFDSPRTPSRAGTPPYNDSTAYYSSQPHHGGAYGGPASPTEIFGGTAAGIIDPLVAMIGEMGLARVSGGQAAASFPAYPNSYHIAAGRNRIPRLRRHEMQAERSLGRMSLFLFYSAFLCLLLF